ncbi:MAG: hypothetical protein VB049_02690 [Candidatus Pelethousia sp.]|nr:hypothetical protein [Candidatus Pelethousia sp.]
MTALGMRALYYILLPAREENQDLQRHLESVKANENNLNQNFTILTKKMEELEARLSLLE